MLVRGRSDKLVVFLIDGEDVALWAFVLRISLAERVKAQEDGYENAQLSQSGRGVHLRCSSLNNLYSTESTRASQLASMMLSSTPTVPHVSVPSVLSMMTRVLAAVPVDVSRMRTLS